MSAIIVGAILGGSIVYLAIHYAYEQGLNTGYNKGFYLGKQQGKLDSLHKS